MEKTEFNCNICNKIYCNDTIYNKRRYLSLDRSPFDNINDSNILTISSLYMDCCIKGRTTCKECFCKILKNCVSNNETFTCPFCKQLKLQLKPKHNKHDFDYERSLDCDFSKQNVLEYPTLREEKKVYDKHINNILLQKHKLPEFYTKKEDLNMFMTTWIDKLLIKYINLCYKNCIEQGIYKQRYNGLCPYNKRYCFDLYIRDYKKIVKLIIRSFGIKIKKKDYSKCDDIFCPKHEKTYNLIEESCDDCIITKESCDDCIITEEENKIKKSQYIKKKKIKEQMMLETFFMKNLIC